MIGRLARRDGCVRGLGDAGTRPVQSAMLVSGESVDRMHRMHQRGEAFETPLDSTADWPHTDDRWQPSQLVGSSPVLPPTEDRPATPAIFFCYLSDRSRSGALYRHPSRGWEKAAVIFHHRCPDRAVPRPSTVASSPTLRLFRMWAGSVVDRITGVPCHGRSQRLTDFY